MTSPPGGRCYSSALCHNDRVTYLERVDSPEDLRKLPLEALQPLAGEIRAFMLETVYRNGGHLGSNLGVVELTVALHRAFDLLQDALVWDVSHQIYPHKILTGRKGRFPSLRQHKGLSGYAAPSESPYDHFVSAHAGTSISTALGMAMADRLAGRKRRVIAVCGDAALASGMAFEALNHAGHLKEDLLVILNDNKMSIARTVGALSEYLNRVRTSPRYQELRDEAERLLDKVPVVGHRMKEAADHMRQVLRHAWPGGRLFEDLGFHYYGPVDGHDIPALVAVLERMKPLKGPVLLHVLTQKGMGLDPAKVGDISFAHAANPAKPDAPKPAVRETDKGACAIEAKGPAPERPAYAKVFGKALVSVASTRPDVVAITAAMPDNTGLDQFQKAYPDRFVDVGICEQHAVGLAGGLAHAGRRPVAAIFSSFLQRAYDQLFHEVSLQKAHVVFGIDRAGVVGNDGPTHHGTADIAYLRPFPHFALMAPKDEKEVEMMLAFALDTWAGPSAIRYPRHAAPDLSALGHAPIELGRSERLLDGEDGVILAYGAMVEEALKAAAVAREHGVHLEVVNARFVKPLDVEMVRQALRRHPFVLTLEEGALMGGFGSAVLEAANDVGGPLSKIVRLGIPDRFIEHATREIQLADCGIDAAGVLKAVAQRLGRADLLAASQAPSAFSRVS